MGECDGTMYILCKYMPVQVLHYVYPGDCMFFRGWIKTYFPRTAIWSVLSLGCSSLKKSQQKHWYHMWNSWSCFPCGFCSFFCSSLQGLLNHKLVATIAKHIRNNLCCCYDLIFTVGKGCSLGKWDQSRRISWSLSSSLFRGSSQGLHSQTYCHDSLMLNT